MSSSNIWFVTGASSGFGRTVTEHLLKVGHKVIATLRKPEALSDLAARYPPTQLLVIKVDVTNEEDVTRAFAKAGEAFGRIDVVFNNAGVNVSGEVESASERDARNAFDVNFWGAARVSTAAVRFFREVNKPAGGRLLQVSSRLGVVGQAACGYYSATKFALEGLSESLAHELDPAWNIKVTILEPGPFRTDFLDKTPVAVHQHPAYRDPALPGSRMLKFLEDPNAFDGDVVKAAAVIEKVSQFENPPLRFPLHRKVVETYKDKAKNLSELADAYGSWSEDLYHDK